MEPHLIDNKGMFQNVFGTEEMASNKQKMQRHLIDNKGIVRNIFWLVVIRP